MRTLAQILLVFWLGCFSSLSQLLGQSVAEPGSNCVDIIYLKSGSILRGRVVEYLPGDHVSMKTQTGIDLRFEDKLVQKIVQKCPGDRKTSRARQPREYSFREQGLYNSTRIGVLVGDTYWGESAAGAFVQHSIGWQINRWLGLGLGAGAENFTPKNDDVATYPIFAEARGYFLPKSLTPYFALAGGYAFTGKVHSQNDFSNQTTEGWRGGWMAQGRLGYRLGNHFTLDIGVRLQQKTRLWSSRWGGSEHGEDSILNKRLELGFGILF